MANKDFYSQIKAILNDLQTDVGEAAEESAVKAAKKARDYLKKNSPKRKRGKYARSWTTKKLKTRLYTTVTIYNRLPGLTMLLEYGHVKRNQYGEYGRTKAQPHIAPAEELGIETFVDELEKELDEKL